MKSFAFFRSFHCLYITYDGLLDPLGQTQILPYIFGLADDGFRFTILSFEKLDRDPQAINHLYCKLQRKNINWIHLPFVRGRFQGLFRILRGAKAVHQISMDDPFAIAHVRTLIPALIFKLSLASKPFIYDIRAFSGQWVDGGRLAPNSFFYHLLTWLERWFIRTSDGLVVLDQSGLEYLSSNFRNLPPVKVIPTSTDLSLPTVDQQLLLNAPSQLRFVCLGGARFPYLPISIDSFSPFWN